MDGISQSELDTILATGRKEALSEAPRPEIPAPRRRAASGRRGKKSPSCAITQDELNRILSGGKH
ncbi:MAG: hypothetical protein LBO76_04155 [Treponema sp.]|jgi:hypothetical protein|nr:hypothetical protein [Treponema sp.]